MPQRKIYNLIPETHPKTVGLRCRIFLNIVSIVRIVEKAKIAYPNIDHKSLGNILKAARINIVYRNGIPPHWFNIIIGKAFGFDHRFFYPNKKFPFIIQTELQQTVIDIEDRINEVGSNGSISTKTVLLNHGIKLDKYPDDFIGKITLRNNKKLYLIDIFEAYNKDYCQ